MVEKEVNDFAAITGDYNDVHVCEEKAKESIFGGRIVHGMLLASYISTVLGTQFPGKGTIYLQQNLKFINPVRIGDSIKVIVEIVDIVNSQKGILRLSTQVINLISDKVAIDGEAVVKIPQRREQIGRASCRERVFGFV